MRLVGYISFSPFRSTMFEKVSYFSASCFGRVHVARSIWKVGHKKKSSVWLQWIISQGKVRQSACVWAWQREEERMVATVSRKQGESHAGLIPPMGPLVRDLNGDTRDFLSLLLTKEGLSVLNSRFLSLWMTSLDEKNEIISFWSKLQNPISSPLLILFVEP